VLLNPLMHIFFLISLVFGFAFGIAPEFFGADQTVLFKETELNYWDGITSLWGLGLIVVTLSNTVVLLTRWRWLGSPTAWTGFFLWLYAMLVYLQEGFWLGLFGAALPNILFWAWYYGKVKMYHRVPPENPI